MRYTYLDKKLGIASIQNGMAPMLADGSIPLYVNVYHTASPTANVTYDCMLDGKKVFSGKQLKEKTNFCWYDEMHLPSNCHGRYITISVKASFADGESAETREIFLCPASGKSGRPNEDWACLLGNPEHIGISRDTLTPPLSLAWINNVGANIFMSSPIVYDKKVYVASIDENATGKASITAFDAANGEILWVYGLEASVKNSIAAAKGKIFAQDIYGTLYAIDASTGSLSWKKQLNVVPIPSLDDGLIASGDTVFAGSGKGLCAIDAETGKEIWRNSGWSQREGTTATLSLGSGVLIGSVQWDALYANDARTGKFLWRVEKDGIRFRAASPAVSGGVLYFISDHSFFKVSAATGEILAKKQLPYAVEVTSTPLLTGDKIIFGSSTTGLHALDRETLEEKWNFMTGEAMIYTAPYVAPPAAQIECSPIASGNYVIFGASDGCFYVLDRDSGSLCWKYSVGAPILNSVAASGNMLFGADFAGNVYGFSK
jgi:outer membrane protein assembly factor BamB